MTPKVISIDIETYGAAEHGWDGTPLPNQTVFHPIRSMKTDGVPIEHLILTCAITLPKVDPRTPGQEWDASLLGQLEPGNTMVFKLWLPKHRDAVRAWLKHADTLIGMNLPFDISYLRTLPDFRFILDGSHTLIDLAACNYLDSEIRPERSLKDIGNILGTHIYAETLRDGHRYPSCHSERLHVYNAQDTHNTLVDVSVLARRIQANYPNSNKLSAESVRHYSQTFWLCIGMSEVGIPFSRQLLTTLYERNLRKTQLADRLSRSIYDLPLEGPGSGKAKEAFILTLCEAVDGTLPAGESILNHKELQFTEKQRKVSVCDENRKLIHALLPDDHPLQQQIRLIDIHSKSQKLLSSYAFPLLHHKRNNPSVKDSIVVPLKWRGVSCDLAFPTWYGVPTFAKDAGGDSGGTEQGRITCKKPAAQTFPPPVSNCIRSRWPGGSIIFLDWSQLELRVAALLSGDPVMISEYHKGKPDLHSDTARWLFSDFTSFEKGSDEYNQRRQCGKQVNFADLFLSTAETQQSTVRREMGVLLPLDIFIEAVRTRPSRRPGLFEWQQGLVQEACKNHRIELPFFGQSRSFHGPPGILVETYLNTIVNFPVQTHAGNLMKEFQFLLAKRLPPLNDINPWAVQFINIYDSVGIDCQPGYRDAVLSVLHECYLELISTGYWAKMSDHYGHSCPLSYDIKIKE